MAISNSNTEKTKQPRKPRIITPRLPEIELIKNFWAAPSEALFGQETIAPVINKSIKTLEADRWRGSGIPYRKCSGRVLYRKSDVVSWIDKHELIKSTSDKGEHRD